MFGFFRNILRRLVETPRNDQTSSNCENKELRFQPAAAPVVETVPGPSNGHHQNGKGIELPLEPILKGLPLELQPLVKPMDLSGATIYFPLEKILPQLSRGVVTIPFGDLRRAAPQLFCNVADRDRTLVPLPLAEILSRLSPGLLPRRPSQKQIEVPGEISSPFDTRGRGLVFSLGQAKAELPGAPAPSNGKPASPLPISAIRSTSITTPAPVPPGSPLEAPTLVSSSRGLPQEHLAGPGLKLQPSNSQPGNSQPSNSTGALPLMAGLTALAESWPEAVRHEIVQLNLVDAKVGLPAEAIERALKQGRIAFTWKMLRSWIRPSPLPAVSAHDSAVLELPLKVVAPLFLARQSEAAKDHQKICIDENIPNLFFGFPQPEPGVPTAASAASQAVATPPDTNYYVWDDCSDTVRLHESEVKRGPSPGTTFVTRYATPNEIVARTAALDGVAGALIALPDGLMVASQLAPDLNGETLAAFLPQIFGKISQCTKELRMGELNNLNFTVGNVPWKIFRVNAIFFAAFGRPGEPLPTAQLVALAAELDHKPK
jgi:predicted regulator of Ras-like GTPase activity (Roadblock/LC7/MglB family)